MRFSEQGAFPVLGGFVCKKDAPSVYTGNLLELGLISDYLITTSWFVNNLVVIITLEYYCLHNASLSRLSTSNSHHCVALTSYVL